MPTEINVIQSAELDNAMEKLREIFEKPIPAFAGIRGEVFTTDEILKIVGAKKGNPTRLRRLDTQACEPSGERRRLQANAKPSDRKL
jgi:hypothetical protein